MPQKKKQIFEGVTEAQRCQVLLCWNKLQQDAIRGFDYVK